MAREFVESQHDISILILPTDYIFKNNLKTDNQIDTKGMTSIQIDSVAISNSLFLKQVSDSVFLETYINNIFVELENLGIKVYDESHLDTFLFIKTPAYLLSIAQIEMEEYYSGKRDSMEFGDFVYFKNLNLNAVSINSWFELNRLNPSEEGHELFFASEEIADFVDGYFSQNIFTGDVQYKYVNHEMETGDLYRYAKILGKRYASYTYDYIMNEHLTENFPLGKERRVFMRYNPWNNTLDAAGSNRFVFIEEE